MNRHGSPGLGPRHDASSRIQRPSSAADKLAALRARVAAAVGPASTPASAAPAAAAAAPQARGGLNVPVHPALADVAPRGGLNVPVHPALAEVGQPHKPAAKTTDSRASRSISARNQSPRGPPKSRDPDSNPYLADASSTQPAGKPRIPRQLVFNQKGKYIAQANAIRRAAALEKLKKKIADQTKKVGLDDDTDVEKNFMVEEPPSVEWFDEGYLEGNTYDAPTKLDLVTAYIQHPIPIEPSNGLVQAKPMYLTTKEQKKMRRQRRGEDLKEQQTKIRLGLLPPEPPKVKLGNLMMVLGQEAVRDPTAIEARVRGEVQQRHDKHVETNEARKLTKEQRHEKLHANQEKDAAQGLHMLVFKINSLTNGQHRYKISVNAEQHALTGVCLLHPKQNLVIVEGGAHSIRKYRKLMLDRIDWTENSPSRDKGEKGESLRQWLKAEDEQGQLRDLGQNRCELIFEGDIKQRSFQKWTSKVFETDPEARDFLARFKYQEFWNMAKSWQTS